MHIHTGENICLTNGLIYDFYWENINENIYRKLTNEKAQICIDIGSHKICRWKHGQ